MTRIPNRTAHIKPSTREAVLDQLAAIADGIIRDRKRAEYAEFFAETLQAGVDAKERALMHAERHINWLNKTPWNGLIAWWRK